MSKKLFILFLFLFLVIGSVVGSVQDFSSLLKGSDGVVDKASGGKLIGVVNKDLEGKFIDKFKEDYNKRFSKNITSDKVKINNVLFNGSLAFFYVNIDSRDYTVISVIR